MRKTFSSFEIPRAKPALLIKISISWNSGGSEETASWTLLKSRTSILTAWTLTAYFFSSSCHISKKSWDDHLNFEHYWTCFNSCNLSSLLAVIITWLPHAAKCLAVYKPNPALAPVLYMGRKRDALNIQGFCNQKKNTWKRSYFSVLGRRLIH